ncbi:MAG: hypothetical protein WC683_08200 [bacterium]
MTKEEWDASSAALAFYIHFTHLFPEPLTPHQARIYRLTCYAARDTFSPFVIHYWNYTEWRAFMGMVVVEEVLVPGMGSGGRKAIAKALAESKGNDHETA